VFISGEICFLGKAPVVKMYLFAIDFDREMLYPLAPPQGWESCIDLENLAAGN
jgi:hypothetical protein